MAIALSDRYLAFLARGVKSPNTVIEVALDSGPVRWGFHRQNIAGQTEVYLADGTYYADGSVSASGDNDLVPFNIRPILSTVSALQNKLDPKTGYSTRGQVSFTIVGRDNFKPLIRDEYLKNRRVTVRDGFLGLPYADYPATFTGKIVDWNRKGDELTITAQDDLVDASKKLPVENAAKTQTLDYRNTNPADIMTNLLLTQLGMAAGLVNSTQFGTERDTWLSGWKFDRVLTEPVAANELLNELQQETNSFVFHDGEKVNFKVFAPPLPGQTVEVYTDEKDILHGSLSCKSGYKDAFYNRVVVYYDYDESGSDGEPNFESAVIAADSASQGSGEWDEVSSKVIKSKWMRSYTFTQPSNITGAVIYHASRNNGAGTGTLAYTASTQSLTWTPQGGGVGEAVKVTQDGKYQVFGADRTKWVRVVIIFASLPVGNQSDAITLTALSGANHAAALAGKILNRYRDPASIVSFDVDISKAGYGGVLIKPTDLKDLTTDEASEHGDLTWTAERVMLTSVRPDMGKGVVHLEAIETRQYRRYGFIAPAGYPDYGSATDAQKEYAYIRDAAPQYHIW